MKISQIQESLKIHILLFLHGLSDSLKLFEAFKHYANRKHTNSE